VTLQRKAVRVGGVDLIHVSFQGKAVSRGVDMNHVSQYLYRRFNLIILSLCLITKLGHDVWRNAGKSPGIFVPALQAKLQLA